MARTLEVLNFENLGESTTPVANGYGGLTWKGADVYQPGATGFGAHGLHSGQSVIYNDSALPMNFFSRDDFALKNGLFSAAQENNVEVTFTGYLGGKQVAQLVVELDQHLTKIHFKDAAWNHVNRVVISTDNATNPSYSQITVDDLKLKVDLTASDAAAPEGADRHGHQHLDLSANDAHDLHALAYDAGAMVI